MIVHHIHLKFVVQVDQQRYVDDMSSLDTCNVRTLIYGSYQPLPRCQLQLPQLMNNVNVSVQMLYQQGLDVKVTLIFDWLFRI